MKTIRWIIVLGGIFGVLFPAYPQSKAQKNAAADSGAALTPRDIYLQDCSGCHGTKGQGDYGPNLTDKYWIHGGGKQNIISTLRSGVTGKGMISWNTVFTEERLRSMSDYVLSFQGTNPPKAKKAEGDLYEPGKAQPKAQDNGNN